MKRDEAVEYADRVMPNCPLTGLHTLCTLRYCIEQLRKDDREQCRNFIREEVPHAYKGRRGVFIHKSTPCTNCSARVMS